jgi:hypothetical protein
VNKTWIFRFKRWTRIFLHLFVIDDSRSCCFNVSFQRGRRERESAKKKKSLVTSSDLPRIQTPDPQHPPRRDHMNSENVLG